ncbi:hypothetical protein D3C85_1903370 [compost metagenome]
MSLCIRHGPQVPGGVRRRGIGIIGIDGRLDVAALACRTIGRQHLAQCVVGESPYPYLPY